MGGKAKQGGRGRGPRNVAPGQDGFPRGNPPPGLPAGLPQLNQYGANWCPECEVTYDCNSTDRRDVTDTCGHRKCRNCMITKDICPQCSPRKRAAISGPRYLVAKVPLSEARYPQDRPEPSSFIEEPNRRRKFSETPKPFMNRASSSSGGPRRRSVSSESSASGTASATKPTETAADAVKRSARIENRRNSASQNPRDADFIMTDLTSTKGAQKNASSSSVSNRSASPAKDRPKLVPNRSPRRASTDSLHQNATADVEQISVTSDSVAGPSTSSSPEESSNMEDSRSYSSVDGTEGANADDNENLPGTSTQPEIKKKKRRNPIKIGGHITVLEGNPQLYQCNVCMKKFKTKVYVKNHDGCQKGKKPFKSCQCRPGQCGHQSGIQCFPPQANFHHGMSKTWPRGQRIPAQEVISTNGNGQTVHQILSPKPAYYQVPENNDRRVVYVIQQPHTAPVQQETLLYNNPVATEVIRDNHDRYATTSQTKAKNVDAATVQIIGVPTLSQEAGPYSAMAQAQYQAQPSGTTMNFPPPGTLFRRNWNGTAPRVETVSRYSNSAATMVPSSQQEIRNQHNHSTSNGMPAVWAAERYTRSRQHVFVQEDDGNGQQVHLARASATVPQMQDSDYQRPAQNSQESRHNGIPHRGHREQYVFQQPK